MLTWTQMQTQWQDMASDVTTEGLTFAKRNMNIGLHLLESELGSFYMENQRTGSTSNTSTIIQLPENFIRLKQFYVTVGTIQYPAEEVYDEDTWRAIVGNTTNVQSNFVQKCLVRRDTIEIWPKPSSANTYTLIYEQEGTDLQNDDYTTGTITTLANLGTAVTGSGTTFTTAMAGRFFKVNTDGGWYPISAYGSATTLTLQKAYQGTAISAGSSAFTIGEAPRTPGPTHHIPVYFALWQWYEGVKKDAKFGPLYKSQYEQYMNWAKGTYGRRYSSKVIPSQRRIRQMSGIRNPNFYPLTIT